MLRVNSEKLNKEITMIVYNVVLEGQKDANTGFVVNYRVVCKDFRNAVTLCEQSTLDLGLKVKSIQQVGKTVNMREDSKIICVSDNFYFQLPESAA